MKSSTKKTLNLPFAEVEATEIKNAIADKFGSVSQFSRLTNRDLYELNLRLRCKSLLSAEYLQSVFEDAKTIANKLVMGYHLTPIQRDKLRAGLGHYPTVVAFCAEYPQFSSVFISRVLAGNTNKITRKVKALADVLSIELVTAPAHV